MGFFLLRWVVLPVLIAAGAFAAGWRVDEWRHASQAVKAVERVVYVTQKQGAITAQVAVAAQAQHDRIVYVTKTVKEDIPYAVPAASDFVLNIGWVRLHNAAAGLSEVAIGPEPADAEPSGAKASDALAVVTDNYGAANECRAKLIGWQDWYRAQQAAFLTH